MLGSHSYAPYGDPLSSEGVSSAFQFTGEMRDASGLTYLRARYYASGLGRFTQVDPSRLEANLYAYVSGNPVNRVDPLGTYWWGVGETLILDSLKKENGANVHTRIQAYYLYGVGESRIHAEYGVRDTTSGIVYVPRIDLLDSVSGEIWEIKPWDSRLEAREDLQERLTAITNARNRLHGLNPYSMPYDWRFTPPEWQRGYQFPTEIYLGRGSYGFYDYYAGQVENGIILWWKHPADDRVPEQEAILLPRAMESNPWNVRRDGWAPPQPVPNSFGDTIVTGGVILCAIGVSVLIILDPIPGDEAALPPIWAAAAAAAL